MKLLLGVTSAAVYAGTRIAAGAVGGAVLGVLLHRRTQQRQPRNDYGPTFRYPGVLKASATSRSGQ